MPTAAAMFLVGELPDGRPVYWADQRFDQPGLYVWQGDQHSYVSNPDAADDDTQRPEFLG